MTYRYSLSVQLVSVVLLLSLFSFAAMAQQSSSPVIEGRITQDSVKQRRDWIVWTSKHHSLGLAWKAPIKMMLYTNCIDTPDRILATLMEKETAEILIATVGPDVSKEQLDDETYLQALMNQQLQAKQSEIVEQGNAKLSGEEYMHFKVRSVGSKEPVITRLFMRRDGEWATTIMMIYLEDSEIDEKTGLPENLAKVRIRL